MMDWIKENKFIAGLGLVTVLLAGLFYYLGSSWGTKAEDATLAFEDNRTQLQRLEQGKPYPDSGHLDARKKEITEYRGRVEGLQKSLLTFRPKEFEKIPPAEFINRLNAANEKLKALYADKEIEVPEGWQLGFESYIGSPPPADATAYLNYELEGLVWLYTKLAEAGPSNLLNVVRKPLPVEEGKAMNGGGGGKGPQAQNAGGGPYHRMPIEFAFRGKEAAVRQFMGELVDAKDFFFTVRSVRIQNDKFETVPEKDDVEFKEAPAGNPFGGAFENFVVPDDVTPAPEGDPAAPAAPADPAVPVEPPQPVVEEEKSGERILGQILGAEELNVYLELELLLFKNNVKLPSANQNS